jgi:predicted acylesterase/phospholipase RssA
MLAHDYRLRRCAGTSAGGLVAAALAFGRSPAGAENLARKVMTGRVLDRNPIAQVAQLASRYGLHSWSPIRKALREFFGDDSKMVDAKMPWGVWCFSLARGEPVFISSTTHPLVSTVDVLVATTAIPWMVTAQRVRGLEGLWWDGGLGANFRMEVWDDDSRPTIGCRLVSEPSPMPVRTAFDALLATIRGAYGAATSTHVSSRHWPNVTSIPAGGDGLEVEMSDERFDRLLSIGALAAKMWLEGKGNG